MFFSTQKRLRTKVHLSAFLTLGEPGPQGHEASRSSFAGPSSRGAKPPRGNAGPVVRARVELRRESAKKTPANIFVDCPVKIERMSGWVGLCGVERESERTQGTGRSYCTTVGLNTESRRPWARRRCGANHRTTTWWLLVVCGTAMIVCCVVGCASDHRRGLPYGQALRKHILAVTGRALYITCAGRDARHQQSTSCRYPSLHSVNSSSPLERSSMCGYREASSEL